MYEDIIELAQNQQFLQAVQGQLNGQQTLLRQLPPYTELTEFETNLEEDGSLEFDRVFREPLGFHLIKSFLISEHSVDKAIFLSDVNLFSNLSDPSARYRVANKIYDHFCAPEAPDHVHGVSVFETDDQFQTRSMSKLPEGDFRLSLCTEGTNTIGVYGRPLTTVKKQIDRGDPSPKVFDKIAEEVWNDLRLDSYPRFRSSGAFKMYIRCKHLETRPVTTKQFQTLRILGRGAFGAVSACIKRDSGKLYAMKKINKRRVQATDSVDTIMSERNFLADMEGSNFVTCLKYAVMDDDSLYLILDLMVGGDLKFHLNREDAFKEDRARFYAAEVLLGLEHIHEREIVYRDLKLENILMDEKGHCKLSDLGLAVRAENGRRVRGYAGTPGYTAPEVVLNKPYGKMADFFSLGVLIYRFLSGKKPFARKRSTADRRRGRDKKDDKRKQNNRRKSSELDRNVVELEPDYPSQFFNADAKSLLKGLMAKNPTKRLGYNGIEEIKNHPWFDKIDFGLLEAGYLSPPFAPRMDEVHASSAAQIGQPPQDTQYERVRLRADFEESLQSFPYVSTKAIQEEMVELLKKVDEENRLNPDAPPELVSYDRIGESGRDPSCLRGCDLM